MLQEYIWQNAYHRAILETDSSILQTLLWQAEVDLQERLSSGVELPQDEALAMDTTIKALTVLAQERLGSHLYFRVSVS